MKQLIPVYEQIVEQSEEEVLKKAFLALDTSISGTAREVLTSDDIKEGVATVLGLILSGPFIVKMFGKFILLLEKVIASLRKKDPTQNGQSIIKFSDKFHHIILKPFEKLAKMITKDISKQKKFANYMFHGVIGILLIHGGVSVAQHLASSKVNATLALDIAKNGIKSAELRTGIRELIQAAASEIGEDMGGSI